MLKPLAIIYFLTLVIVTGCTSPPEKKMTENHSSTIEQSEDEDVIDSIPEDATDIKDTIPTEIDISDVDFSQMDSMWNYLVFQRGGCLNGGQYVVNKSFGGEGCVMTSERVQPDWTPFFLLNKRELTLFLVEQFSDTSTTKIHTCPCFSATAGETAVYCLHNLYKKNWYDLKPFLNYQKREGTGCMDHPQSWLQSILADKKQCQQMKEAWLKELH